jgi:hypothetical protein
VKEGEESTRREVIEGRRKAAEQRFDSSTRTWEGWPTTVHGVAAPAIGDGGSVE